MALARAAREAGRWHVQHARHRKIRPSIRSPRRSSPVWVSLSHGSWCCCRWRPPWSATWPSARTAGKETGETALLRRVVERLNPGDILLADRFYCSYFLICLLLAAKVDFVTRLHQRHGRLPPGHAVRTRDHGRVVAASQAGLDGPSHVRSNAQVDLREGSRVLRRTAWLPRRVAGRGDYAERWRYTRDDLAELYHRRWLAELDIRAIKVTMGMDVLRAKSPEMVRREIWACLLAYNLVRQTVLASALQAGCSPRQLSFAAALQKIAAGWIVALVINDSTLLLD